ncbi:DUF1016 N-terminal domain-containing protein [Pedobacter jejuensis]|uniref:DUF1016 family protein n=1 Tax=Pedobacter jejuensis TaxID=1268550 RepID=A0A3N0C2U9_9SPHI|nr:DUF1016 N-terminal domain-containing protein [Pedobacter jejuensis]RNL56860.1 DUF1016 family protein [Pedobacter jejuensis]
MELSKNYIENIKALKSAILQSRYRAASLVNKELLTLYFAIGKFISHKIEEEKWGAKVIEILSADLQVELPGLRGFSATNIKRMRLFFEAWKEQTQIRPTQSGQLQTIDLEEITFRPTVSAKLEKSFFRLSFSHHLEIIQGTQKIEEKIFYIQKTASEIILCKEKKNKIVEFSFRDFNKAMGVSTYKTSAVLPAAYKGVLPDVETLKKLMD